jgi:hypothetical protein
MPTPAQVVSTYIHAKDENRPHLMSAAFAESAVLEMVVKSGSISFPPRSVGLPTIADVLVRKFGQTFENVYTVCLASAPVGSATVFDCAWLVGMSEKAGGAVRVGCGTYRWHFQSAPPCLAERLTITIERMEVLPSTALASVMQWFSALPYPWCPPEAAARSAPALPQLRAVAAFVEESSAPSVARP